MTNTGLIDELPQHIWAADARIDQRIDSFHQIVGLYTSVAPTGGNSTEYVRADVVNRLHEEIVKYRTALNRIAWPEHWDGSPAEPLEIARKALVI
jgi:hypothetical protein